MSEYNIEAAKRECSGIITSGLLTNPPLTSSQHGGLAAIERVSAFIDSQQQELERVASVAKQAADELLRFSNHEQCGCHNCLASTAGAIHEEIRRYLP